MAARSEGVAPVLVGGLGVVVFSVAVEVAVVSSLADEPGSMSAGFGQLFAVHLLLVSVPLLWWSLHRVRRAETTVRRWSIVWLMVVMIAATSLSGALAVKRVVEYRADKRALEAAASVESDLRSDQSDAYRAWYHDHGGDEQYYTGDFREWWSLDPDGDGHVDSDAPVRRLLRDMGWSERGVTMFDVDDDLVVDQLQWTPASGSSDAEVWCATVSYGPQVDFFVINWREAVPGRCKAPPSTSIFPAP